MFCSIKISYTTGGFNYELSPNYSAQGESQNHRCDLCTQCTMDIVGSLV